jgi:hypothetical protein
MGDVEEFLNIIYPDSLSTITYENVFRVLPLVEEYQVFHLKPACENVILEKIYELDDEDELFYTLDAACLYGFKNIQNECVSRLAKYSKNIISTARSKYNISAEVWIDILERKSAYFAEKESNFQRKEEIMKTEIQTQREYIQKFMFSPDHFGLEEDINWETNEMFLKVTTKRSIFRRQTVKTRKTIIGNRNFDVSYGYKLKDDIDRREWLIITTYHDGQDTIRSKVRLRCTIFNTISTKDNKVVCTLGKFGFGKQNVEHAIKLFSYLSDENNGFVVDGCVWILVQIFISNDQ